MPFYKKRVHGNMGIGGALSDGGASDPSFRPIQDWQEIYAAVKAEEFYSGTRDLGNGHYQVEIFSTHNG